MDMVGNPATSEPYETGPRPSPQNCIVLVTVSHSGRKGVAMAIDKIDAVKHLDDLISQFQYAASYGPEDEYRQPEAERHEVVFGLRAALRRLAPPGSVYARALDEADQLEMGYHSQDMPMLAGAAIALRNDYANDRLQTYRELFNAHFLDDFLSMSEYLIEHECLKDPAAVLAGGVLERHIRDRCESTRRVKRSRSSARESWGDGGWRRNPSRWGLSRDNPDRCRRHAPNRRSRASRC